MPIQQILTIHANDLDKWVGEDGSTNRDIKFRNLNEKYIGLWSVQYICVYQNKIIVLVHESICDLDEYHK
jgi:hypothetical protein